MRLTILMLMTALPVCHDSLAAQDNGGYRADFPLAHCATATRGSNRYFVLQPGYRLVLDGEEESQPVRLVITVTDDTQRVDGVWTRVVEERESHGGQIVEISRNYFAICPQTRDVYYFGESVDIYRHGAVASHEGSWRAGAHGARAGLVMPGTPLAGDAYYQEHAPGVAMDRARIVSLDTSYTTPGGAFEHVLEVQEGSELSPAEVEYKYYAPGVGLIRDEDLLLTSYGVPGAGGQGDAQGTRAGGSAAAGGRGSTSVNLPARPW